MGTYHILNPKKQKVNLTYNVVFMKKPYFIDEEIKHSNLKSQILNMKNKLKLSLLQILTLFQQTIMVQTIFHV